MACSISIIIDIYKPISGVDTIIIVLVQLALVFDAAQTNVHTRRAAIQERVGELHGGRRLREREVLHVVQARLHEHREHTRDARQLGRDHLRQQRAVPHEHARELQVARAHSAHSRRRSSRSRQDRRRTSGVGSLQRRLGSHCTSTYSYFIIIHSHFDTLRLFSF